MGKTMESNSSRDVFTVKELASRWRCSTRHIYRLIKLGDLEAIDIGTGDKRKLVVTEDAIQRFNAERRVVSL